MITQELIQSLFDYKDGELYWKVSKGNRKIGNKAGSFNDRYYNVVINKKRYYLHQVIFIYHYDYLPSEIDHIDGNPLNNNIENLRETIHNQNMMNRKPNKNSSSKYKGVYWNKNANKWIARIKINNKSKHLGYFINEIDVAKAYNKSAIELFKEYANLNEV